MKKSILADTSIQTVAEQANTTPENVRKEINKVIIAAQTSDIPSEINHEIRMLTARLQRLPTADEVVVHMIQVNKIKRQTGF